MQYFAGPRLGELHEYTLSQEWVVFVSSSKETLLFPLTAKRVVDLIRQSEAQSFSMQELNDFLSVSDPGLKVSDELLSSLVRAGILSCR